MSFTYGSFLFFLTIPTITAFLLGLLFWGKLKAVRYFFWIVCILFLLLTITTMYHHAQHNSEEAKGMLGNYKLDLKKSKYHKNELTDFADLVLTVKDNNTFSFSKQTLFFPSTSGKWNFEDDGDIAYTECSYDNTTRTFQIMDGFNTWTFESYQLKDGVTDDLIVFAKTGK